MVQGRACIRNLSINNSKQFKQFWTILFKSSFCWASRETLCLIVIFLALSFFCTFFSRFLAAASQPFFMAARRTAFGCWKCSCSVGKSKTRVNLKMVYRAAVSFPVFGTSPAGWSQTPTGNEWNNATAVGKETRWPRPAGVIKDPLGWTLNRYVLLSVIVWKRKRVWSCAGEKSWRFAVF